MSLAEHYAAMAVPVEADVWHIHDPSRVLTLDDGSQILAATGKAQEDGYRCGLELWRRESPVSGWAPDACLLRAKPAWISEELPGQDGAFWAPEIVDLDRILYSASVETDEANGSCTGVAVRTEDGWRDQGAPLTCAFVEDGGQEIAAIDPSAFLAEDGRRFLVLGGGVVHASEVDPSSLKPLSGDWYAPGAPGWSALARGPRLNGRERGWIEAPYIYRQGRLVLSLRQLGRMLPGGAEHL